MSIESIEKHYTISQVAALTGIGYHTVRRAFKDHPDALRINTQARSMIDKRKGTRPRLYIPESLVLATFKPEKPVPVIPSKRELRVAGVRTSPLRKLA